MVLVNLNPKPDYEYYRSKGLNKSYKGVPRGTPGISTARVLRYEKLKLEKLMQNRFQVSKGKMTMKTVSRSLFVQLNNKRFYFGDGIMSMPIGHCYL